MTANLDLLKALIGSWEGNVRTWFEPGEPADESSVRGTIGPLLGGRFVRHEYTGSMQGRPRHGEETFAFNKATSRFEVAWVDDFHMSSGILFSEGEPMDRGFVVRGSWAADATSPRWGWKTVYELADPDHLTITAYIVTPEGEEAIAVETVYRRKA